MTSEAVRDLLSCSDRLFTKRDSLINLWQEVAEQFYPEAADFSVTRTVGRVFSDNLFACDPVMMRRQLGDAFSWLRAKNREWYKMVADGQELDDDEPAQNWFDMATKTQRNAMYDPVAQFDRAMKPGEHFYAAFGNAVISIEVNASGNALRYGHHHLRDCAWVENGDGQIDQLHRKVTMTARQMSGFFTMKGDALPSKVNEALTGPNKDPNKEFQLRHITMPGKDWEYQTKRPRPAGAKFTSLYVETESMDLVREAVSYEFRYIVPRWAPQVGSQYGLSPAAITALPEARMLQALARIIQEAGEKSVDPPMTAVEKAIRGDVQLYAGGVTWVDKEYDQKLGKALEPITLAKDPRLGVDLLMRSKMLLEQAWFVNALALPEQGQKTAYEVSQLIEQHIRANVPLFEPVESELYVPLLNLTADILLRVGAFGDPKTIPQSLRGKEITFKFHSPLQAASEQAKVMQFQNIMGLMQMAALDDPSSTADLDVRTAFRDAARGTGAPANWLRDRQEADGIAEQRQQAQQAMQAVGAVGQAGASAEAVGKGVQSLAPELMQKNQRKAA